MFRNLGEDLFVSLHPLLDSFLAREHRREVEFVTTLRMLGHTCNNFATRVGLLEVLWIGYCCSVKISLDIFYGKHIVFIS